MTEADLELPHPKGTTTVYAVLGTEGRVLVHTGATELYSQLYNRALLCISNLCTSALEKGTMQIFLTFFLFLVGILIVCHVIFQHTQTCYILIINIAGDVHHLSLFPFLFLIIFLFWDYNKITPFPLLFSHQTLPCSLLHLALNSRLLFLYLLHMCVCVCILHKYNLLRLYVTDMQILSPLFYCMVSLMSDTTRPSIDGQRTRL